MKKRKSSNVKVENDFCKEWLTVDEMRNYMRAGRTKSYEMIRRGEVESYRLGRKILISKRSIDEYIALHGSAN